MTISLSCLLISNFCHKSQTTIQMMNKLKIIQLYNSNLSIKVISWAGWLGRWLFLTRWLYMVPNYLSSIADQILDKKNKTVFHIKCTCGCSSFLLAKNKQSEVDQKNPFDNYWNSFKLPIFSLQEAVDKKMVKNIYMELLFLELD